MVAHCMIYSIRFFLLTHLFYLISEFTPEGKRVTKLDSILLNGNNIAIVRKTSQN